MDFYPGRAVVPVLVAVSMFGQSAKKPETKVPVTAKATTASPELQAKAEQGDADAQITLGVCYAKGLGVPQDFAEALKWYRLAAGQGHAEAQFNLGVMYHTGKGVPQDYVEAHKWFNLSAARATNKDTRENAAGARDSVASKMTPDQIAEAQKLAREWTHK